jgi:coproporphyrinogen III oxidase
MSSRGRSCVDPNGGQQYAAAALSLVFHPRSPFVPTFRADVRRFTVAGNSWYGGGADLTPYYLFDEGNCVGLSQIIDDLFADCP